MVVLNWPCLQLTVAAQGRADLAVFTVDSGCQGRAELAVFTADSGCTWSSWPCLQWLYKVQLSWLCLQ